MNLHSSGTASPYSRGRTPRTAPELERASPRFLTVHFPPRPECGFLLECSGVFHVRTLPVYTSVSSPPHPLSLKTPLARRARPAAYCGGASAPPARPPAPPFVDYYALRARWFSRLLLCPLPHHPPCLHAAHVIIMSGSYREASGPFMACAPLPPRPALLFERTGTNSGHPCPLVSLPSLPACLSHTLRLSLLMSVPPVETAMRRPRPAQPMQGWAGWAPVLNRGAGAGPARPLPTVETRRPERGRLPHPTNESRSGLCSSMSFFSRLGVPPPQPWTLLSLSSLPFLVQKLLSGAGTTTPTAHTHPPPLLTSNGRDAAPSFWCGYPRGLLWHCFYGRKEMRAVAVSHSLPRGPIG